MGYIDVTDYGYSSSKKHTAHLYTASKGVDYSTNPALLPDGKVTDIKNMWLQNGILTSFPKGEIITDEPISGTLFSRYRFCGKVLLHIGSGLFAIEKGEISEIFRGFPEKISIPVEFGGDLYYYCNSHIFKTNRDFNVTEVFPTPQLYKYSCHSNIHVGTKVTDFKPNLIAPYIAITYYEENRENFNNGYIFPEDMDFSRSFHIYFEDRLLEPSEYTFTDRKFNLTKLKQTKENSVKLCYYSTNPDLDKSTILSECKFGTAFGGGGFTGTRVFLSGNDEQTSSYFTSELGNPLLFYEGEGGKTDEGVGKISGFSKQKDTLLIFTDRSVSRLSYNFNDEVGGYFTTRAVSSHIGCDVPESIATVMGKTVFVSADRGIYMITGSDAFDYMSLVEISHCITDYSGKRGFFETDYNQRKNATCTVFDNKYILSLGKKHFIWDFGDIQGQSISGTSNGGKKLSWFTLESETDTKMFSDLCSLYGITQGENGMNIKLFKADGEDGKSNGNGNEFFILSSNNNLSLPHTKKTVCGFAFECNTKNSTYISADFFADGKKYKSTENIHAYPNPDGFTQCYIKLPPRSMERFMFKISGNGENVGIFNFKIDYMVLKEQKGF